MARRASTLTRARLIRVLVPVGIPPRRGLVRFVRSVPVPSPRRRRRRIRPFLARRRALQYRLQLPHDLRPRRRAIILVHLARTTLVVVVVSLRGPIRRTRDERGGSHVQRRVRPVFRRRLERVPVV
eukprot:31499-Pelagococcus_subviridis.AAC.44